VLILPLSVQRSCKMKHITQEQRYTISVLLESGKTQTEIAKIIGKHKSSISREITRNSDQRNLKYKSDLAQRKCKGRHSEKKKSTRLTSEISEYIDEKLSCKYSPEQIVGRARLEHTAIVSHERIYQYIWENKKEGGTLYQHLRSRGKRYRKRGSLKDSRGIIPNRKHISERPQVVEEKSRLGDVEIDTVIGKNHKGALVTINDRKLSKVFIRKVDGKNAQDVMEATIEALKECKYIKTITADNGKEFAYHEQIAKALNVDFFFATPYHSWERGANENMNGLIRQYIPKKTNFDEITDEYVKFVENELNNRPRKKLGYLTPNEAYLKEINLTEKVAFIT
jgi:IS30 family transposase